MSFFFRWHLLIFLTLSFTSSPSSIYPGNISDSMMQKMIMWPKMWPRDVCSYVFCCDFEMCVNTMCSVVCCPLVAMGSFGKKNVISISLNPHCTSVQLTEIHSKLIRTGLTNLTLTLCNPYPIVFSMKKIWMLLGTWQTLNLWNGFVTSGFISSHLQ